eukprot:COSAG01_NODE_40413_length_463_cov_10037.829670_1_plen_83_part_10
MVVDMGRFDTALSIAPTDTTRIVDFVPSPLACTVLLAVIQRVGIAGAAFIYLSIAPTDTTCIVDFVPSPLACTVLLAVIQRVG